jgi:hypothetical protein
MLVSKRKKFNMFLTRFPDNHAQEMLIVGSFCFVILSCIKTLTALCCHILSKQQDRTVRSQTTEASASQTNNSVTVKILPGFA